MSFPEALPSQCRHSGSVTLVASDWITLTAALKSPSSFVQFGETISTNSEPFGRSQTWFTSFMSNFRHQSFSCKDCQDGSRVTSLGRANFDGLMQDCGNSSALELSQSCIKPLILYLHIFMKFMKKFFKFWCSLSVWLSYGSVYIHCQIWGWSSLCLQQQYWLQIMNIFSPSSY